MARRAVFFLAVLMLKNDFIRDERINLEYKVSLTLKLCHGQTQNHPMTIYYFLKMQKNKQFKYPSGC